MPKIEVNEDVFYSLAGRRWDTRDAGEARASLEDALTCAKAELDEDSDKSLPQTERTLKIELNDTNRPDLWATAGCARQLRIHNGGKRPEYPFFSRAGKLQKADHKVLVEASVKGVRPYLAGFIASGKPVTDASLRDMIQTQEKLAWNFGRKRRTISMGLYRIARIRWPISYKAVDPDSVSFVPLQWDVPLTLREILKQHPKGKEYAFIQEHEPLHPLLLDSQGAILSYPPIINSADLGAVQVGDTDLFVELTGTDQPSVTLSASIMACDLADQGYTIKPVEVEYEYDTPFGKTVTTPYYFQEPVFCSLARVEKFLGEKLSADECLNALERMGVIAEKTKAAERGGVTEQEGVRAWPPEYRNDFLHAADVAEDVMIGRTLKSFKPERPRDFTVGRLTPITYFSRRVKELLVGMSYQEMIYNYLGSRKNLVENMRGDGGKIIRIANPMSENYEYVRDSVLASLMQSESVSGAVFPHRIFEVGKVAYLNSAENSGTSTRQYAGFLHAGPDANFNTAAADLQTLFYYISREYEVEESTDTRFIPGRAAVILYKGKQAGVFGEIHPEVLENWGVTVPCIAAEVDLDTLLE
ncbi:phenylalanyl-tRNA synthetase, beta subunit [Treponema primitia ZAS-2]|uniref:phenylalanine--tRNA ligase n=1 Tax=Treponema primitia (strain ATCC BAA-887 / DSM 12427 / ZAS-2) TaxID=545694 RepID=F5YLF5_TREPZ|nr:phenylalanine--tRNA ligase subunit beta [Treponema primitia]AEF85358.1 phenylalanyl-tRNA synthetase, beta subunit [Treponema primitia ZAS-2]